MEYDKSVHCCTKISLLVVARFFLRALQFACLFYFVGGISKSCKDYKRSSYLFPILMFVPDKSKMVCGSGRRREAAAVAHTHTHIQPTTGQTNLLVRASWKTGHAAIFIYVLHHSENVEKEEKKLTRTTAR